MRYGSVCSGIEAATVAWHPLGWEPAFFAEIDKFPSAVLRHHYPDVPNHGDFTTIKGDEYGAIDVLVGGTPCQDFSIAGLRAGLDGERGNLTLEFLKLIDRTRPRWVVWENVPGVLSSTSHRTSDPCPPQDPVDMECDGQEVESEDEYDSEELHAFNSFLAGLSELGYGWAYRILDAQHFGVPQRRRRIFVIGYPGDWRRAAAVLFESFSLQGHTPPSREKRQTAPTIPSRRTAGGGLGTDFDCDGGLVESSVHASTGDVAHCLNAGGMGRQDYETETLISHALRGEGFDASEGGTGRGTPLVPVAARTTGNGFWQEGLGTLRAREQDSHENLIVNPVAYRTNASGQIMDQGDVAAAVTTMTDPPTQFIAFTCKDSGADAGDISPTLRSMGHNTSHANAGGRVAVAMHTFQKTVRSGARDANGELPPEKWEPREIAATLNGFDQGDKRSVDLVVQAFTQNQEGDVLTGDVMHSLGTNSNATGRNATNVAISFEPRYYAEGRMRPGGAPSETVATLKSCTKAGDTAPHVAIGWSEELTASEDIAGTIQYGGQGGRHDGVMTPQMAVRRLTPVECERLQGFPDGYTKISDKAADGPRYKALGNSMAVPVMCWIGERIQMVDAL